MTKTFYGISRKALKPAKAHSTALSIYGTLDRTDYPMQRERRYWRIPYVKYAYSAPYGSIYERQEAEDEDYGTEVHWMIAPLNMMFEWNYSTPYAFYLGDAPWVDNSIRLVDRRW